MYTALSWQKCMLVLRGRHQRLRLSTRVHLLTGWSDGLALQPRARTSGGLLAFALRQQPHLF
jgi:hypothetical protein